MNKMLISKVNYFLVTVTQLNLFLLKVVGNLIYFILFCVSNISKSKRVSVENS